MPVGAFTLVIGTERLTVVIVDVVFTVAVTLSHYLGL